jgi:nucleoside 2-deoxyribosyltransferase
MENDMIYIAGPLFSESEREFNEKLERFLSDLGHETFLPQRDGHELATLKDTEMDWTEASDRIFKVDIDALDRSDIVVFVMDGRVPDEGACVEIGYAFARGKECIGLKTDPRALMDDIDNPMITGALKHRVAGDFCGLEKLLAQLGRGADPLSSIEAAPI